MRALLLIAACAPLAGCMFLDANRDFVRAQSESNPAGVKGLLQGDELRYLSVAELVASFADYDLDSATTTTPVAFSSKTQKRAAEAAIEQARTDKAIAAFYQKFAPIGVTPGTGVPAATNASSLEMAALYRNEIQDRILAAANQRCHLWKNYYASASSTVGFTSGVVSAATSAAAVAFSPTSTKDALTAVSATSTAVGTNYDRAYAFGLTLGVVFQGVDSRRANILQSIVGKRINNGKPVPLSNYTLSAAIEDALEYHAACSVASGTQEAAERIADARPVITTTTTKTEGAKGGAGASSSSASSSNSSDGTVSVTKNADGSVTTKITNETKKTSSPASIQ